MISRCFPKNSASFKRSSSTIMSKSRMGLTSPSTCKTSSSLKARTTWKIPSTALMWERKAFPKPKPSAAPLDQTGNINYSQICRNTTGRLERAAQPIETASGTATRASSGSIVQKGKFSARAPELVKALKGSIFQHLVNQQHQFSNYLKDDQVKLFQRQLLSLVAFS